ncbi:MAG: hypothetical protein MJ188_05420 [Treponema sp.]|nr:hypothetical protein [Treponema sp.]
MSINVYNESHLHKTIKLLYAENSKGQVEVNADGHIYDIVTCSGEIIEIQTKNLASLLPKIMDALQKGRKITLVHPVIITKKINLYDEEGKLLSSRKSPKKGSIYDIFRELTGIYPILLHKNFALEILEVNILEIRKKMTEPVQTKNQKRRYKKDWIKTDKRLDEIINRKIFKTKKDYLNLLPDNLPKDFCAKDLIKSIKESNNLPSTAAKSAYLIIWVYSRMNLLTPTEIRNRNHFYKITESTEE